MTTPLSHLLEAVTREHFPLPPATPEDIAAFEQRMGWRLDPDLRAFYLHCDGASLLRSPDSPYQLLPLSRIVRARVALYGRDEDRWGPASVYAFCSVRDGNYVLLD
ncbi:MAG: SMI1/KNR4 family protein, partial [Cystobacter sp.]